MCKLLLRDQDFVHKNGKSHKQKKDKKKLNNKYIYLVLKPMNLIALLHKQIGLITLLPKKSQDYANDNVTSQLACLHPDCKGWGLDGGKLKKVENKIFN